MSITSIGGFPGTKPTTNTNNVKPIPDTAANPKPPKRTPITRQAIRTINPKIRNTKLKFRKKKLRFRPIKQKFRPENIGN